MKIALTACGICLGLLLMTVPPVLAENEWLNGKWIGVVGAQAEFDLKAADNGSVKGTAKADTFRGMARGRVTGTIDEDKVILEVDWSVGGTPRFKLRKTKDGLEGTAVGRSGRTREVFFEKAK